MNTPVIVFETIKEFKAYCKIKQIQPTIQLQAKKHQNMKGEYLHDVNVSHDVFDILINESVAYKEKRYPTEKGYKLSHI